VKLLEVAPVRLKFAEYAANSSFKTDTTSVNLVVSVE
jgi:hypothetical protein